MPDRSTLLRTALGSVADEIDEVVEALESVDAAWVLAELERLRECVRALDLMGLATFGEGTLADSAVNAA